LLRNHHAFESKVQEAQVAQVVQVNQVARERPEGLRAALQEALALKDQAEEDQAEEDQAEKECGVRIPNDSSSGPWNSIVMAMASSIATS
jgi:hypothetical protein